MVPKSQPPRKVSDFRPISCCDTIYKYIAKPLANKLQKYLPFLISSNQSAFIENRKIIDNILVVQEVVKDYAKNKGKPKSAIKIDIMKEFNSVHWGFVINVLTAMGFLHTFVSWIQACITTPKFSVKSNGVSEGFFSAKRGLSQGDPLSPYMFVICMEVFTRLLDTAAIQGQMLYHPLCARISLTNFCIADDLLVFSAASVQSLLGIKHILDSFYKLSGLRVSFRKSEICICAVSHAEHDLPATLLGVKVVKLLVRYLGVPLIADKLRELLTASLWWTKLLQEFTSGLPDFYPSLEDFS